ncbi:MAG: hypothetical protein HC802_18730, partial [Caldilineaceae bacterium]|nr:hypothetical protein [Caldilineaceae bacterium]
GLMGYLTIVTALLLFVMTPLAAPLWEAIPPLSVIQFPWRLLALTAFTLSALAGLGCAHLLGEYVDDLDAATSGALAIAALVVFASYAYIDANLEPVEPWREDGRAVFRFESEHPDMIAYTEWVDQPFTESPMSANYADPGYSEVRGQTDSLERLAILTGAGEVLENFSRGSSMGGVVRLTEPSVVQIRVLNFPGWQVRVDGELTPHQISAPFGLLQVELPAGEHTVEARMGSTPVRQLGALLSWGTLAVVAVLCFWPIWQRQRDLREEGIWIEGEIGDWRLEIGDWGRVAPILNPVG